MDSVSQQVVEEVQATMAGTDGIYHKIEKVLTILESNGWAQKMTIQPKDILCHPSNRGGAMLSFYDVWSKGKAMLSVGLQKKLLHGSIAMKVSKKSTKRRDQIAKNQQLVKDSQGHLAPVSGQERFLASFCFSISQKLLLFLMLLGNTLFGSSAGFLSLSSSHTVAFLRAMEAGVPGPDGHQAEVPKADASWQCIDQGWLWVVISSVVEEAIPQLVTWLQFGHEQLQFHWEATNRIGACCHYSNHVHPRLGLSPGHEKSQGRRHQVPSQLGRCHHICPEVRRWQIISIDFLSGHLCQAIWQCLNDRPGAWPTWTSRCQASCSHSFDLQHGPPWPLATTKP
jgi:hypothetical protein